MSDKKESLRGKERLRRRRLFVRFVIGIVVLLAAVVVFGIRPLFQPASTKVKPVRVEIPSGAGVGRIGEILQEDGIIRSGLAFQWVVRWRGAGGKLKAGIYHLSGDMTLGQIIEQLKAGPGRTADGRIRVTIPEGFTLAQIAEVMTEKGITDGVALKALATDRKFIAGMDADFPLPEKTLEGYLYPDTYAFKPHTPPALVLNTMVLNFSRRFARPYQQEIGASGRPLHALVTAASLIEREARMPQDRARIAGVLDNRLKKGMKLQIDATVLYALGHHKEVVTFKDLEVDSPYNTYLHKGLPPGAIASPGLESLKAALHPEAHDFLYYVARPNGEHIFSRTAAEHEAAIRQAKAERQQGGAEGAHGG